MAGRLLLGGSVHAQRVDAALAWRELQASSAARQARRALASAGSERIHFAGEAMDLAQTCGGAYLTGIQTAQRMEAVLGKV